ncbi:FxLYD domain-containing protein [Halogeometricum luteum]|uniref:FxLYD domain-containing protein n=1 Tax=Halogeometricum luteum TaxID=2950537 RepID=A0ABU2G579_9EURY|nr:FxLYD domain-containing protein [Halogeometricum sp. S3BR5-2]MDS0295920.1 FxLYD domain-containing protein [Halogeometricum sp. S3BR5-2]
MTRTRRAVVRGVGIAALAGLAGCSGNSGSGGETTSEAGTGTGTETASSGGGESVEGSVRSSSTPLEITEQTYFEQENVVGVSGSVENTGDSTYSLVKVHLSPMEDDDPRGKFFATTETQNVDQLGPGETWNFVVAFDKSSIESFNQYEVWVTGLQQSETGNGTGTASGGTETAASFE